MVDLFEEVDEELRSERYRGAFMRILPWLVAAFVIIVGGYLGYWAYSTWQDKNVAAAAADYQKGMDAQGEAQTPAAVAAFNQTTKSGTAGYKTLALMQLGNGQLAAGKADAAAKFYDQAADAAPDPVLGDLAKLKAAEVLLDTAPYAQIKTRLAPLTDPKRPYSLYAKEALAMAKLMAGMNADARKDLSALSVSLGAPEDMRQRAQLTVALIDQGQAPAAVAAAKAAASLPPTPPQTLQLAPGVQGVTPSPAGAVQ